MIRCSNAITANGIRKEEVTLKFSGMFYHILKYIYIFIHVQLVANSIESQLNFHWWKREHEGGGGKSLDLFLEFHRQDYSSLLPFISTSKDPETIANWKLLRHVLNAIGATFQQRPWHGIGFQLNSTLPSASHLTTSICHWLNPKLI